MSEFSLRMSKVRPLRPTPGLVVAVVALIVALGGTSYAAFALPNNSVGSNQLRNGAVRTKNIRDGAVTDRKIKSVAGNKIDFNGVAVPAAKALTSLPAGSVESGSFAAVAPGIDTGTSSVGAAITFSQPLPAPVAHVLAVTTATPQCPGIGKAAAGYLCLYLWQDDGVTSTQPTAAYMDSPPGAGKYGVTLYWTTTADEPVGDVVDGSWSVSE